MNQPSLILASSSPYRQQLLTQLKLNFQAISPEIDESCEQQNQTLSPLEIAQSLAKKKALAVQKQQPGAVIIGSDQVACLGTTILNKPGNRENNLEQLKKLSGQTHELLTAVCVLKGELEFAFHNQTQLTMREFSSEELERYVDNDRAFDCAGGYKIEGLGIALFSRIKTSDHSSILGLPLIKLTSVLRQLGFQLP